MIEAAVSKLRVARRLPRWAVLRLATVTGVSAGWWVMTITAGAVGAVAAAVVVTLVYETMRPSGEVVARLDPPEMEAR